jgi:hypothetical protein
MGRLNGRRRSFLVTLLGGVLAVRVGVGVVAVLVLLIGAVFAGQGLGYIPGSFMTGDIHWFWIGSGMVVVGLVLGAAAVLRKPRQA